MTRRISTLLLPAAMMLAMLPCWSWAGQDEQAALQKEVERFSANGTLDEALAQLSELSGLKIQADWGVLKSTGLDRKDKVAFSAPKATVEQLLEMTLARASVKDHPLAWYLDGKIIRVTSQEHVLNRQAAIALDVPARTEKEAGKETDTARTESAGAEIKFDNTPFGNVITYLRQTTHLNFNVNWKSLEEANVTKDTPVTLNVKDISSGRLLDLVLDQVSGTNDKLSRVYWVVDDGVVTIATGNALNNNMVTRVVDVSDILVVVPNFKGPDLDMTTSTGNNTTGNNSSSSNNNNGGIFQNTNNNQQQTTPDTDSTNMAEARAKVRESLISAIKDSIGDDMWKPDGKGTVTVVGGKLVITQSLLGFKLMENAGRKH